MSLAEDHSLMFSITVRKRSDFLSLENAIRTLARCHGRSCSFFQSASYIALRLSISAFLFRPHTNSPPPPTLVSIPTTPLLLVLLQDGRTLQVIQSTATPKDTHASDAVETAEPAPLVQKRKSYKLVQQEQGFLSALNTLSSDKKKSIQE